MRKRIINQGPQSISPFDEVWLDLENSAQAELTSEDASHPIESALKPGVGSGWRALGPGQQAIRLLFDKPLRVKRVRRCFAKMSSSARMSSCCGGPPMAASRGGKSFASSSTLILRIPPAKLKTMKWILSG